MCVIFLPLPQNSGFLMVVQVPLVVLRSLLQIECDLIQASFVSIKVCGPQLSSGLIVALVQFRLGLVSSQYALVMIQANFSLRGRSYYFYFIFFTSHMFLDTALIISCVYPSLSVCHSLTGNSNNLNNKGKEAQGAIGPLSSHLSVSVMYI